MKAAWPIILALSAGVAVSAAGANPSDNQEYYFVRAAKLPYPQKLTLASVQALANAKEPALFVLHTSEDPAWLKVMEKHFGAAFQELSLDEAMTRFAGRAPQVIYDSRRGRGWTVSLGTTLAGIHQAILTDHDLGQVTAFNCRDHWTNKVEAYRWALRELKPSCNPRLLVYLDEVLPHLRDFAIQQKAFVLNLDPLNKPDDIKLLEEILGRFPAQTRVFGWATGAYADKSKSQGGGHVENALVNRLSQRAMMLIPADFASNLSFYDQTGAGVPKFSQPHLQRGLKFEPDKRYALLVISDGDNLQYDLRATRQRWRNPERPKIPLAWTISPQLAEVAPVVLHTYYQESAERGGLDEFVAGPSGYGYVNPGNMTRLSLGEFVQLTQRVCELADLRSVAILDHGDRPAAAVMTFVSIYAGAKFDGLWLMAMPQYVGVSGRMAFANERFRMNSGNAASIAQKIKTLSEDNPFAVIYTGAWPGALKTFAESLDPSCLIVSPTEMAQLIRQWQAHKAR